MSVLTGYIVHVLEYAGCVLCCWTVFSFTVEVLNLMVFCYQFKVFVLIYVKGIPVLYCVCVYIYICDNTCVIVTGSCLVVRVQ